MGIEQSLNLLAAGGRRMLAMAENGANSGSYFSVEGKTCDALREWLCSHGLSTNGKKADLKVEYRQKCISWVLYLKWSP